jgi:hypothetical protein
VVFKEGDDVVIVVPIDGDLVQVEDEESTMARCCQCLL